MSDTPSPREIVDDVRAMVVALQEQGQGPPYRLNLPPGYRSLADEPFDAEITIRQHLKAELDVTVGVLA